MIYNLGQLMGRRNRVIAVIPMPSLLLESGSRLLLESGGRILLE